MRNVCSVILVVENQDAKWTGAGVATSACACQVIAALAYAPHRTPNATTTSVHVVALEMPNTVKLSHWFRALHVIVVDRDASVHAICICQGMTPKRHIDAKRNECVMYAA